MLGLDAVAVHDRDGLALGVAPDLRDYRRATGGDFLLVAPAIVFVADDLAVGQPARLKHRPRLAVARAERAFRIAVLIRVDVLRTFHRVTRGLRSSEGVVAERRAPLAVAARRKPADLVRQRAEGGALAADILGRRLGFGAAGHHREGRDG